MLGRRIVTFCEQSDETVVGVSSGVMANWTSLPPGFTSNNLRCGMLLQINTQNPYLRNDRLNRALIKQKQL